MRPSSFRQQAFLKLLPRVLGLLPAQAAQVTCWVLGRAASAASLGYPRELMASATGCRGYSAEGLLEEIQKDKRSAPLYIILHNIEGEWGLPVDLPAS